MINMWICRICDHKAGRRGNIIRHLKLIHSIDDRNGKNVYRENCKDGKAPTSMDSDEFEQQTSEVSHGLQSNMSGSGIPLSDIQHPKRLLKDERYSHRQEPRRREYDETEEEEDFEDEKRYQIRYQNLPEQELTEERIDEIYGDLKAKKRRILDSVLKTIPEHLHTRAKRFCDALKCKDRLIILPNGSLNIDGKTLHGSHIHRLIMQEVEEPPTHGSIQYILLEDENKTLRKLLKTQVKALARATGLSRIRKFESLDGTIDYFDYSDDTNSDDSNDGEDEEEDEEDEDGTNTNDTDGTDGTEEDEYDEEEADMDDEDDEEEYEEYDEPSKKKKNRKWNWNFDGNNMKWIVLNLLEKLK